MNPVYPSNVPGTKGEEIVVLAAQIRADGTMGDVQVVGEANPAFANAALDAVRQWAFDETLLNCVPIEVAMRVTARFRSAALARPGVRFQLALPNGARPELAVDDGALATLSMPDVGSFGFRTTIRDRAAGLVNIVLLEGTKPDGRVMGEVNARVGEPAVKIGTSPAFTVSIVSIR